MTDTPDSPERNDAEMTRLAEEIERKEREDREEALKQGWPETLRLSEGHQDEIADYMQDTYGDPGAGRYIRADIAEARIALLGATLLATAQENDELRAALSPMTETDMTDTPDSPERIWVDDERPIGGSCHVYTAKTPGVETYAVEYVRADLAALSPAPVEGLVEAASDIVNDHDAGNWSEYKVEALRAALAAYGERKDG